MNRRKSTARAKQNAASQEERIHLWKQHFKNLRGKSPTIKNEPITKIISNPLDIKLGQFKQELVLVEMVLRKILNRKAAGLDEIPPEVWKTRKFDDILQRSIKPEHNRQIDKGLNPPFPQEE